MIAAERTARVVSYLSANIDERDHNGDSSEFKKVRSGSIADVTTILRERPLFPKEVIPTSEANGHFRPRAVVQFMT